MGKTERNEAPVCSGNTLLGEGAELDWLEDVLMHGIIYLVGLIVVVMALLSFVGLR